MTDHWLALVGIVLTSLGLGCLYSCLLWGFVGYEPFDEEDDDVW